MNLGTLNKQINSAINDGMSSIVKIGNKRKSKEDRYNYDVRAIRGYCGDGFYLANYNYMGGKKVLSYGKDIHWAYGSALVDYEFPLTNRKGDTPTKCGIYSVKFTRASPKDYIDFTLYLERKFKLDDGSYGLFLTNLDYEIFMDMYDTDAIVVKKIYYQDIGPLPEKLKALVRENYIKKKQANEDEKRGYEAAFYGCFALDMIRDIKKKTDKGLYHCKATQEEINETNKAIKRTGLSGKRGFVNGHQEIRPKNVIIATFQTAYVRYREWQIYKQHKDKIIYMNTDSVYSTEPIDTGEDKGLGCYGVVYENKLFLGIRRNAYIILNEDGTFYKSVVGGVMDNYFTQEQIDLLVSGYSIKARTNKKIDGKKYESTIMLTPTYIKGDI